MQKKSLERVRALSDSCVGVFPVTLWRDATRAVFERVRGSSIGHRRPGEHVSAEHTRYRIQQEETLKKHFPKKIIYFVTVYCHIMVFFWFSLYTLSYKGGWHYILS